MQLSIVIPALNEEEGIGTTIQEIRKALEGKIDYEIVVVDDGSSDKTPDIAEQKKTILVRHERNRGYGAAIKTGVGKSRYDTICLLDADCTYPPEEILELLKYFKKDTDIVSGSRFLGKKTDMPLIRKVGNLFFIYLTSLLVLRRISDVSSGMKIISKKTFNMLEPLPNTLDMMLVITIRSIKKGLNYVEIPIGYNNRKGRSKLSTFKEGLRFLKTIVKTTLFE